MVKRSESHQRRCTDSKQAYEKMLDITSLGNSKLKQDATPYLLEWQKSKMLPPPNAGKNVKRELSFIAGGITTVEDCCSFL